MLVCNTLFLLQLRRLACTLMLSRRASEDVLVGLPVRLHREILPGDAGTLGATVPWMRRLVLEGRRDPLVGAYAQQVIASNPALHPADAIFRHVQSMPYAFDEAILERAGFKDDTSEMLQGAPYQVEKSLLAGPGAVVGDCDDRAILTQSLLESQGIPTRFVLVRGPGREDYSHVYSEAALGGSWVPLDTIMDGKDGRPFFGLGEEAQAPLARDRMSIGVDEVPAGVSVLPLLLLAALYFWRKS